MGVFLDTLVALITFLLNLFGILFILWGGIEAAIRVAWGDMKGAKEEDVLVEKTNRKAFASKLILGLEFFIAVDLLATFEHVTWEGIGKLAALIVVRALISFVLTFETKSLFHLEKIEKAQIKSPKK
jgi:uncharacterized membrane protein